MYVAKKRTNLITNKEECCSTQARVQGGPRGLPPPPPPPRN